MARMTEHDRAAFNLASALCLVWAIGIWGWQSFQYAKFGRWPSWSVIDQLGWFFPKWSWVTWPMDWLGVHSMLASVNTGLALVGASLVLSAIATVTA